MAYPSGALILLEAATLDATLSDGDPVAAWAATQGPAPTVNGSMSYEAAHATLGPAVSIPTGNNTLEITGLVDSSVGLTLVIAAELDLTEVGNDRFIDSETGRLIAGLRSEGRPFVYDSGYRTFAPETPVTSSIVLLTFVIDGTPGSETLTVYEGRTEIGSVSIAAYNGLGARTHLFGNYLGQGAISKHVGMIGLWPGIDEATRTAIWDEAYTHFPTLVSAPTPTGDVTGPTVTTVSGPEFSTDPWVFDVTDEVEPGVLGDGTLARVIVTAIHPSEEADTVYDGDAFLGPYSTGSSTSAVAGGTRFTVYPESEWYGDMTLRITAVDTSGNITTADLTATGAPVPVDQAPVVTLVAAPSHPEDPLVLDVTDDAGLSLVILSAQFPDAPDETIWIGEHVGARYSESTRVDITGGYRFTLRREGGWGLSFKLLAEAVDNGGNRA